MVVKKEEAIRRRVYPKIYDPTYLLTHSNIQVFKYLLNILPKDKTLSVLDLGCGYKPFKYLLEEHGIVANYIGVDFSLENAEPDFIVDLNKENLPFEDESFDLIIISEVLEHIYKPFHVLDEAIRVLKKGGLIYISTPFILGNHEIPYDYFRYTDYFYKRYFEENNLEILHIRKAGSILSAPFFIFNLFMEALLKGNKIKFVLTFPSNIFGLLIDLILQKLSNKYVFVKKGKEYLYLGISLIAKK
ncbi:MAG: class I SAM-dependent methyltransferase [Thermodesulfobacteriaceae bacterium]|jgi:SAM-dependent methyltransferase